MERFKIYGLRFSYNEDPNGNLQFYNPGSRLHIILASHIKFIVLKIYDKALFKINKVPNWVEVNFKQI